MKKYLAIIFLLITELTFCQDPAHWQLTDEQGLPSMTVYEMLQDSKGYIWMGTGNGLCRYDGKEFKRYNSLILKDFEILDVREDRLQRIWFTNLSNQLLYIENDTIKEFLIQEIKPGYQLRYFEISENYIWAVLENSNKVKQNYCLIKIELGLDEFLHLKCSRVIGKPILKDNIVHLRVHDEISQDYFLFKENGEKDSTSLDKYHYINSFYPLFVDDKKVILGNREIKEESQIKIGNYELNLIPYDYDSNRDRHIFKANDEFWIASLNGIFISKKLSIWQKQKPIFLGIKCNYIIEDHEKNIWISTTGSGVFVIPNYAIDFFSPDNSLLQELEVFQLKYNDIKNQIFVGHSKSGISLIEQDKEIETIDLNLSVRIRDIDFGGSNNDTILLTLDHFVYLLKNDFSLLSKKEFGGKILIKDSNNNIWLGNSIGSIFIKEDKFEKIHNGTKLRKQPIVLNKKTYAIFEDFSKNIWLGSTQGIYCYKDSLNPILENGKLFPYNVSDITQTPDSSIWVSTLGNGILKIKNKKIIGKWDETNGLTANLCKRLIVDEDQLWIGTNNGINVLNWKTEEFKVINNTDGLASNEINDILIVDDQAWIGTPRGLFNFSKNTNHLNSTPPPIHITSLKIWEQDTLLKSEYDLEYDQNNFQIEFVGLGFRAKGNITYKYRMSEIDNDWVYTNTRFARYPLINPGTYQFEILAINEDGIESEQPAKINFNIASPWWQTWWFRILTFLLIIGLFGLIFYLRLKNIRKRQIFKDKIIELKQEALKTQMNPHFIFNSLNAIQQFLTTNDEEQAMFFLARFARLIRLIFDQSKKKLISLDEELELLDLYLKLEKLRFGDRVNIQLDIHDDLKEEAFDIQLPPLLIQPIIENAFKHGLLHKKEKGKLKITFKKNDEFLICEIEDNGIGRKKAAEINKKKSVSHQSTGLKTTIERLDIINDSKMKNGVEIIDLYDSNQNPKGTKVSLKINCEIKTKLL